MIKFFEKMIGKTEMDFIEELQMCENVKGWTYDDDCIDPVNLNVETTEGLFVVCIDEGIIGDFVQVGVDYAEDDDYSYEDYLH